MKEILNIINKKEKERKMIKKLFTYIFIYTLLTFSSILLAGCEDNILNVTAPDLEEGLFGNYTMEFLDNYTQTFTKLNADTGTNKNYEPSKKIYGFN